MTFPTWRSVPAVFGAIALTLSLLIAPAAASGTDGAGDAARVERPGGIDGGVAGEADATAQCPARDTSVPYPYAVTGTWIYLSSDPCVIRSNLEGFHKLGGDTVLQFAPRFTLRQVSADGEILDAGGNPVSTFTACRIDGRPCYLDTLTDLRADEPGASITDIYTYQTAERFGPSLYKCALDGELLAAGDRVYSRLLLADDDPTSCRSDSGRYRLVLIAGSATDGMSTLVEEAAAYGMGVYVPLPASPNRQQSPWEPDLDHLDALLAYTERVLTDYTARFGQSPGWYGVYQSFELQLKDTVNLDVLTMYADQHAVARQTMPGRLKIAVSPYMDARKQNANGTTPEGIETRFELVGRTGVDIIAPQDSRGTGKIGLHWPHQADDPVDPRLANSVTGIAPGTSYGDAYHGNTMQFLDAAEEARHELAADGIDLELWVNIESMDPATSPPTSCYDGSRTLTDKARLDRALTFAVANSTKVITYRWNNLWTCPQPNGPSLADQIAADHDRPIVTDVLRRTMPTAGPQQADGLTINGFHLGGDSTVSLQWYDSGWNLRSRTIDVADQGRYDPDPGSEADRVEELWVPFDLGDVAPNFYVHVHVTDADGKRTTHRYSFAY